MVGEAGPELLLGYFRFEVLMRHLETLSSQQWVWKPKAQGNDLGLSCDLQGWGPVGGI